MKKIGKIILRVIITIFIIVIILFSIAIYITKFEITDVEKFYNEEHNYKIIFQEVGDPEWPFGDTKVKVILLDSNNKKVNSFEEYISDDGAGARKENIIVNWNETYVEITLRGSEQKDEIYRLEYQNK